MLRMRFITIVTALAVNLACAVGARAQILWINPGGGNWGDLFTNDEPNWNPLEIPDSPGESAVLGNLTQPYSVAMTISPNIDSLDVATDVTLNLGANTLTLLLQAGLDNHGLVNANGDATLTGVVTNHTDGTFSITSNRTLSLFGPTWTNNGQIDLGTGTSGAPGFNVASDLLLGGTGTMTMRDLNSRIESTNGATLTHDISHVIDGRGSITALLDNRGVIRASLGPLTLTGQDKTNTGTLTVQDRVLTIRDVTIHNDGGLIDADGTNVELSQGAVVDGGMFDASGAGVVLGANCTIQDVTNIGTFRITPNTTVTVTGSQITNDGVMELGTGSSGTSVLDVVSDVLFTGTGEIVLRDLSATISTQTEGVFRIDQDQTIRGRGRIEANTVNEGLIVSDTTTLTLTGQDKTNNNQMIADTGKTLRLEQVTIANAAGVLLADGGIVEARDGCTILGGTLDSRRGGVVLSVNARFFDSITNLGLLRVQPNASARINATITNEGTIELGTGSSGVPLLEVDTSGNATLTGTGDVFMRDVNAAIRTQTGVTLTNDTGHTIHGRGVITGALINHGTLRAEIGTLRLTGAPKTNNTVIRADSSILALDGFVLTNTSGVLRSDGVAIRLEGGARIIGGILDTTAEPGSIVRALDVELVDIQNDGLIRVDSPVAVAASGSTLTNNATIELGTGGSGTRTLQFLSDLTVTGPGDIHMRDLRATLATSDGATVTIGPGQTVHGRGSIPANLINEGEIIAESSPLVLDGEPKTNRNRIAAEGAILRIDTTAIDNTEGVIQANGANVELLNGAHIVGGSLESRNGGIVISVNSQLDGVTNLGTLRVQSTQSGRLVGAGLVNDATLNLGTGGSGTPVLSFEADTTLGGTGIVNMLDLNATIASTTGFVGTIGPDQTVRGRGVIRGAIVNQGTISVEPARSITLEPLDAGITNQGRLQMEGTGRIIINNAVLFTNNEELQIEDGQRVEVNGGDYVQIGGTTTVSGELRVAEGDVRIDGGVVQGEGLIGATVRVTGGSLSPGLSAGTLTLPENLEISGSGTLTLEIGGTRPGIDHDVLNVTGQAVLGGVLDLPLLDGFLPQQGDDFEVLGTGGMTGRFDTIQGQTLPDGMFFVVSYKGDRVVLFVGECQDVANHTVRGKTAKIRFKMDTGLEDGERVTVTATNTTSGEEFDRKRRSKRGRSRGAIKNIPAGNYDVCITRTPTCGRGCFETKNVDVR